MYTAVLPGLKQATCKASAPLEMHAGCMQAACSLLQPATSCIRSHAGCMQAACRLHATCCILHAACCNLQPPAYDRIHKERDNRHNFSSTSTCRASTPTCRASTPARRRRRPSNQSEIYDVASCSLCTFHFRVTLTTVEQLFTGVNSTMHK